MDKEKRITIRVPAELHLAVKIKAAREDQPVSDVIRTLSREVASGGTH